MENLIALSEIRYRHPDEHLDKRIDEIIGTLVETGYWPEKNKTGHHTARKMWEGYGPRWNEYSPPFNCHHCDADLRNMESGPPFKREIGIIENDRVANLRCPDCGKDF